MPRKVSRAPAPAGVSMLSSSHTQKRSNSGLQLAHSNRPLLLMS